MLTPDQLDNFIALLSEAMALTLSHKISIDQFNALCRHLHRILHHHRKGNRELTLIAINSLSRLLDSIR